MDHPIFGEGIPRGRPPREGFVRFEHQCDVRRRTRPRISATCGEPTARTLVFVTGFEFAQESAWNYPRMRALWEGLASGRRLVTFDSRGVGSSQRVVDDLTIPAQVADLAAVVDRLGLETFDLIGILHGGPLAAAYAVEHPERVGRFVLLHPFIRASDSPLEGFQDLAQTILANWSIARRTLATLAIPNGPADMQRSYSRMLRESVAPEVAARHTEVVADFDGRAILGNVQAPTLVLANSGAHHSRIASVRAVASLIPDARFLTYEDDEASPIRSFLEEADAESEAKN